MKIIAGLIIKRRVEGDEMVKRYYDDIMTYIYNVDKLIILNVNSFDQTPLLNALYKKGNIEVANYENCGQVVNYQILMQQAIKEQADYITILEEGYYYHDDAFLKLRNAITNWEDPKPSILTPNPLFTCEEEKNYDQEKREIKGCHLTGALINVQFYKESNGFISEYYQTTFDYDYCIEERLKDHKIYILNNCFLKNRNYLQLIKKILGSIITSYEISVYDLYYETRNRYYLWNKFKGIDDDYIKLDKKQFKKEIREIRAFDKNKHDKLEIVREAKKDYENNVMGKKYSEVVF